MATVIRRICDPHFAQEEHEATPLQITLGGPWIPAEASVPRVMDVCDDVWRETVAPFLAWFLEHSREDDTRGKHFPCPFCVQTFSYRKKYIDHVGEHLVEGSQARKPERPQLPVGGIEPAERTYPCGSCEKVFTGKRGSQLRGLHRRREHGIAGESVEARRRRTRQAR